MRFRDRVEAGQQLAELLKPLRDENPLVLALPRGGVPVGYEVARALGAALDVLVVRKLGAPGQPELGLGAIAEGGAMWVDPSLLRELDVSPHDLEQIAHREAMELERRIAMYRGGRPLPAMKDRTVIVVDDGVATGATVRAAIKAIVEQKPRRLILAVPVIAAEAVRVLRREVDDLVRVVAPEDFYAVGAWYDEFSQTGDEEVISLLEKARDAALHGQPLPPDLPPAAADPEEVAVPCEAGRLAAFLEVPRAAHGLVVFAHGTGSGRRSPRNQHVARVLRDAGLATLLLDLLTPDEEGADELTGHLRFDIEQLARRLVTATRWARERAGISHLPAGYFGASTGAGAALLAAAQHPELVQAIVSRGGRPDLAGAKNLALVRAPTLLIVGGQDREVLQVNREALAQLNAERRLVVVPGATHLFEEPGALDTVARLAAGWLAQHLVIRETLARV
ncbi:MAG TPA: phosphoribosyltransferase family protein [Myxococcales bacterium]|nr:phosphoribosyltransferase family protein [Myxococcales bacterium]